MLDRRGAEQRVDLVEQATVVLALLGAAQQRAHLQQFGDATDLAFHRLAPGLGRVGGEHRVELKLLQQGLGLGRSHLGDQLVIDHGQLVDRIDGLVLIHLGFALAQHGHTVILLAEICQMEVRGEGAGHQLGIVQVHRVDDLDRLAQAFVPVIRIIQESGEMLGAGLDRVGTDLVEHVQQLGIELVEHFAQDLQAQFHIVAQRGRQFVLLGPLRAYRCHNGQFLGDGVIVICHIVGPP